MVKINRFKGMAPRVAPELLPDGFAQVATNCKTDRGTLRPYRGNTTVATPAKTGIKKTIYLFGGQYWFHWLDDVDVVKGPVAGDVQERTYFTGDGAPKVTDASIAVQGGTLYPMNAYTLGLPAPAAAPVCVADGVADDTSSTEERVYVVTYVSGWGEEGPPSPASAPVVVGHGQHVDLSSIPGPPAGAYNVTHKRIYRSKEGAYFFVAQILAATTVYEDTVETVEDVLVSTLWDQPPADMFGLCVHPGGFMVGFSGNEVCFSEAYVPSAWPESYRHATGHPIVGGKPYGNSILVCTTGNPYIVSGSSPDSMLMERVEIGQACVSKRGIVDMGEAVMYPSPDGLIMIGVGVAKNATEKIITRDDWQAMEPATIFGACHDGKYFGFHEVAGVKKCFIFDPSDEDFRTVDLQATAAFAHLETDTLYLQVGDNIVSFDTGAALSMTWKSQRFLSTAHIPPAAKVTARAYPVTFKFYADEALVHTQTVANEFAFRLPPGHLKNSFEAEVSGTAEIVGVQIGNMAELR